MKNKVLFIFIIAISVFLSLSLHWRILEAYGWPRLIYATKKNLGFIGSAAIYFGINPIRFKEILYFIFDLISLIIIFFTQRKISLFRNFSLNILLGVLAILYFTFYPYNKFTDVGFQGIYVLMTLSSSITIYILGSLLTTNLREYIKIIILYLSSLIIILITVGQWDPRILLYPLTLVSIITFISFFILLFYKRFISIFLKLIMLVLSLSVMLYLVGNIRVKLSEAINPAVPLNLDAFKGKYDIPYLVSGNSWNLSHPPSMQTVFMVFLSVSAMLVLLVLLFLRNYHYFDNKNEVFLGYILILTYAIVLLFERNIHTFIKILLNSNISLLLINKYIFIRDLLIMYRIPRFMDFTNRVIVPLLIIIFASIFKKKKLKQTKNIFNKIIIIGLIFIIIIVSLSNVLMLNSIIKRGTVFNYSRQSIVVMGLPSKILQRNFAMADWTKEKLLLMSFLYGEIKVGSLYLYDNGIIPTTVKAYANIFSKYNFKVKVLNLKPYFAIVNLSKHIEIGKPLLIPQGLYLGSKAWEKGYVPIYLDQVIQRKTIEKILQYKIPIVIYKNKILTSKILAIWFIVNGIYKNFAKEYYFIKIIAPSMYARTFSPRLTYWSPGFIGDPHHGIFYEPARIYEYDYTYKLNWGIVQGRAVKEPLKIPFKLRATGNYTVIARLMSTGNGLLKFYVDGQNCGLIRVNKTENIDSKIGFIWVNICNIKLKKGMHLVKIYWYPEVKKKFIPTLYLNLIIFIPEKIWKIVLNYSLKYVATNGINISKLPNITRTYFKNISISEINYPFLGKEFNIHIIINNIRKESPWVFVIRLPWGYPLRIEGRGIIDSFLVPIDYVKSGVVIIPSNTKISIQLIGFEGYVTPMSFIKMFITCLAVMLSLYIPTIVIYRIRAPRSI